MAGTPYLDGALCGIVRCQSVGTGRPITDAGIKEDKPPRLIELCSTAGMQTCSPLAARVDQFCDPTRTSGAPSDTSPNTVSLHVLTVLSCCASYHLLFVTYAMIARQGRSRYCLSIRLGQNGPQTLRRASYHGKSACASMLRHTPARDDGGEPPCRVSLPCIGIL